MESADHKFGLYIADAFAEEGFRESLQLITDGVRAVAGFDVAAVSVLRETDEFEFIAVSGGDDAAQALIGSFNPRAALEADIERGERWGRFRFIPPELQSGLVPLTWTPDVPYPDAPNAWHRDNSLVAPLYDDEGRLIGLLSIDVPLDGLVPTPERRSVLDLYAVQAERVLVRALEQARLAEHLRLITGARAIVRSASTRMDLDRLLAECLTTVRETFRARGIWVQVFADPSGRAPLTVESGPLTAVPEEMLAVAERTAKRCWQMQQVAVISGRRTSTDLVTRSDQADVLTFLREIGRSSLLSVPLGAGTRCLGNIVLTRNAEDEEWSDVETDVALDIGRDLGTAVLNARLYEHDREMMAHLEQLDRYKSDLIATITHELKNPLTAVRGYLELLDDSDSLDDHARHSVSAMRHSTDRLATLVEDLLVWSQVSDPHIQRNPKDVDLRKSVLAAMRLLSVQAATEDITVVTDLPTAPQTVTAVPTELDILCTNLISNAVKYTPSGGKVTVRISTDSEATELSVRDTGIGISAEDQERLFEEFFRSADPDARERPGTGLGLAIVARIAAVAGASVSVDSALGEGSTFRVRWPRERMRAPGVAA